MGTVAFMNRTAILPKSKTVLKPKVDTMMVMTYSDDGNIPAFNIYISTDCYRRLVEYLLYSRK